MAAASDICEIDLLNNLSNRLAISKEQFTNVGPTLLIVNPYQKDKTIYSNEKIEYYINLHNENPPEFRTENKEPHLFDLVLISIEKLLKTGNNQAIIISGESGSGKTEAAKNAMNCIIYFFQGKTREERKNHIKEFTSRSEQEPLEKKILSCNPILEAFGNCKTLRNDNSSRFGKYVTINIDFEEKKVIGASIITYLLEKSRITTQAKNERNFHILFFLLSDLAI
jgi:myosin heavy subunit